MHTTTSMNLEDVLFCEIRQLKGTNVFGVVVPAWNLSTLECSWKMGLSRILNSKALVTIMEFTKTLEWRSQVRRGGIVGS